MVRSTAALAALNLRTGEPPARFALELRPEQSPKRVREEVKAALAEFDPSVMPISPVDHGVLILELPQAHAVRSDPARAYAAGYALAEDFDLRTAEPDLPTPFFPEEEPAPQEPRRRRSASRLAAGLTRGPAGGALGGPLDLGRGPVEGGADLISLDLGDRPLVTLGGLPSLLAEPAGDHHPVPLGQGVG